MMFFAQKYPALALFATAALLLSCNNDSTVSLNVFLRTDFQPVREFATTELIIDADSQALIARIDGGYIRPGEPLSEFTGLAPSSKRSATVKLLRLGGSVLQETTVYFEHNKDIVITIAITRDCSGVTCDDIGGAPARCLAGKCQNAECISGQEEVCEKPECEADTDCPKESPCASPRCESGVCFNDGKDGDCDPGLVCDVESGVCIDEPTPCDAQTDCAMPATCQTVRCSLDLCIFEPAANGTACTGGSCQAGICAPPPDTCTNALQDNDESDIDCGGVMCSPCAIGKKCVVPNDCVVGASCQSGICATIPICENAAHDGDETDVDCGGTVCAPCDPGKMCAIDRDCTMGNTCQGGVCATTPICENKVKDGDESDVDCGGITCARCADGQMCGSSVDCMAGSTCQGGVCMFFDHCSSGVIDGDETDVDCGGATCPACVIGGDCTDNGDCSTGFCEPNGVCREMTCGSGQAFPLGMATTNQWNDVVHLNVYKNRLYIANRDDYRVPIYGLNGERLDSLLSGQHTGCDLCGYAPQDIEIHPDDGRMYIATQNGNEVIVLNADKSFNMKIPLSGFPYSVAYHDHRIYVVAHTGNRVAVFDEDGAHDFDITGLSNPTSVRVDNIGRILVVDRNNDRVRVFDALGVPLFDFGSPGSGDGQFSLPVDIAVDSQNNYFVTDETLSRITKFDSSGTFLSKYGSTGSGDGQFNDLFGIAIDENDNIYTSETQQAGGNNRIQKFDKDFVHISTWPHAVAIPNGLAGPIEAIQHSNGKFYAAEVTADRISIFDCSGNFETSFGGNGSGNGQLINPRGIKEGAGGNLYVVDSGNNRIQVFDATGAYQSQFGSLGSGNGQFNLPLGIAIDSANNVYTVERNNDRVQKFSSAGVYITSWGSTGSGNGQFDFFRTGRAAVDGADNVYAVDDSGRVQKFTSAGTFVASYGGLGDGDGIFVNASAVAIHPTTNNIFVSDLAGNIEELSTTGTFLNSFGTPGEGYRTRTEFTYVTGLTFDNTGNLLLAEHKGHRVLRYGPEGKIFPGDNVINATPVLGAVANDSIAINSEIRIDTDTSLGQDVDADQDPITYSCQYDTVVNGAVDGAAAACTDLTGLSFFPGTGVLRWTPTAGQDDVYEIKVGGTDGNSTDETIFTLTVTP